MRNLEKLLRFGYIPFLVSLSLLIFLVILFFLNKPTIIDVTVFVIFILLSSGVLYSLFAMLYENKSQFTFLLLFLSDDSILKRHSTVARLTSYLLSVITAKKVFLVVLLVLLYAGMSEQYFLGGDDSRLYYLYPWEYVSNYASRIGPETAPSAMTTWLPPTSILAFALLLVPIKFLLSHGNLQSILYTANLIGGFFSFYLLISYIFPEKKTNKNMFIYSIGSIAYTLSIFNVYTLYNSQLIAIYLLSTFPISIYLYLKGITEQKKYLLVVTALLWSIFCYLSVSLPWFAGAILTLLPLFLMFFWEKKKQFFKYTLFFITLLFFLNIHWFAALSNTSIAQSFSSSQSGITSQEYRKQNESGIKDLASHNSVIFPLLSSYHYFLQKDYNWPYLPIYESWNKYLLPMNIFILLILIIGGLTFREKTVIRKIYFVIFLCFLIAVYLFTVNIGAFGLSAFVWLSNNVPGFVMFRNMYDKFAYGLGLASSMLLTVSLYQLLNNTKAKRFSIVLSLIVVGIIILNAKPLLRNEYNRLPIWTTKNSYNDITSFNSDFLDLVAFIKQHNNASRYLWLPLNHGNISQIEDNEQSNHYYNGVSPILFLTGKNDYSGILSFENFGSEVVRNIKEERYHVLGNLYQKLNVKYIIVNHTVSKDLRQSYICGENLCDLQNETYKSVILGKKIRDFGKRYSIYEINNNFANDKIIVSENISAINNTTKEVHYKKLSNTEYEVFVNGSVINDKIYFHAPYNPAWEIRSFYNREKNITAIPSKYNISTNAWNITSEMQSRDGSIANSDTSDTTSALLFRIVYPTSKYIFTNILSLVFYIFSIMYVLKNVLKRGK